MTMVPGKFRATLIRASALAIAAVASWGAATWAAHEIETRSAESVALAMKTAGYDWVEVAAQGLQVQLSGTAPSEAARFRAVTKAGAMVDSKRVVDLMDVLGSSALQAPEFTLEILRNDDGVQLIGLIPAAIDREELVDQLNSALKGGTVTDLLETADYPVPMGWARSVAFAVESLSGMPRAKVSVEAGRVSIIAITESAAEKARLETDLSRRKPDEVALATDISAPRPVITPFTLRFLIDDEGARFDACAADNDAGRDRILKAAEQAGATGILGCTLGLGAPTRAWSDGAVQAIGALHRLGQGSVTFTDADIALIADEGTDPALFDQVVGELESNLPDVFSLDARLLKPTPTDEAGPKEFVARLTDEGGIELSGRVADERQRDAIEAYARARFGSDKVRLALRVDDTLPDGWALRGLAGLEALAALATGEVHVQPDLVRVQGVSGDGAASDRVAQVLGERIGAGARYELRIRYNRRLDPLLGLPDGEECVDGLNNAVGRNEFTFEPNKYGISGDASATLDAISKVMAQCDEFRIEVGGHTDSQGSEGFNQELSEGRAKSVLTAMAEAGIPTGLLSSKGYGEDQPIASNETEAGRDANRRIEFKLLDPEPVQEADPAAQPVEVITGTTGEAAPEAAAQSAAPSTAPSAVQPQEGAPQEGAEAAPAQAGDGTAPAPAALPDGPPAEILQGDPAAQPQISGDSLTLDGYTVTIIPAEEGTATPAPRPDRN